jgi:ribosomal protein S18 acetylase RimI-like enzyme
MDDSIRIGFAGLKDIKELSEIEKAANKEHSSWIIRRRYEFRQLIDKKRVLVARRGGSIAGYINFKKPTGKKEKSLWLEDIYVKKESRRMHVAKAMIYYLIRHFDIKYVALLTPDRNMKIFRRMGFKKPMNWMSLDLRKKK